MPVCMPFEIQAEIIRRLPIKSVIQFRSVSKPWKSLIDSSEFIASYSARPNRPQNLLVCYVDREDSEVRYVSIVDDDTFPQHKFSLSVPMSVKRIENPELLGSSQGLLFLYTVNVNPRDSGTAVLWNPYIRKSVVVDVPNVLVDGPYETAVGFGVSPHTSDPMLVKIMYPRCLDETGPVNVPWQVEVFTLSTRAWRSLSINLPEKSIALSWNHVALDRFIYWLGYGMDTASKWYQVIMSFDMSSEEFTELCLPDSVDVAQSNLVIYNLSESLVLLESSRRSGINVYDAWMMENGVPNLFTKLFTFTLEVPNVSVGMVLGFTKRGEPLAALLDHSDDYSDDHFEDALIFYERFSKHISYVGISAKAFSCNTCSYTETLLLLDH